MTLVIKQYVSSKICRYFRIESDMHTGNLAWKTASLGSTSLDSGSFLGQKIFSD